MNEWVRRIQVLEESSKSNVQIQVRRKEPRWSVKGTRLSVNKIRVGGGRSFNEHIKSHAIFVSLPLFVPFLHLTASAGLGLTGSGGIARAKSRLFRLTPVNLR
jgi:hypothetical protein